MLFKFRFGLVQWFIFLTCLSPLKGNGSVPACIKQGLRSNHRIHIQLHLATDRLLAYCDPGHIFSGLPSSQLDFSGPWCPKRWFYDGDSTFLWCKNYEVLLLKCIEKNGSTSVYVFVLLISYASKALEKQKLVKASGGAGTYPSCHMAKGWVRCGQTVSVSQG